jgi:hypothetical protein
LLDKVCRCINIVVVIFILVVVVGHSPSPILL